MPYFPLTQYRVDPQCLTSHSYSTGWTHNVLLPTHPVQGGPAMSYFPLTQYRLWTHNALLSTNSAQGGLTMPYLPLTPYRVDPQCFTTHGDILYRLWAHKFLIPITDLEHILFPTILPNVNFLRDKNDNLRRNQNMPNIFSNGLQNSPIQKLEIISC